MLNTNEGNIPLRWWTYATNFGDVLGPWLAEKIANKKAIEANEKDPHYMIIGSILGYVRETSIVWGIGSFGTEVKGWFHPNAKYLAVRGPLTRNKLVTNDIPCPAIYGDPALLLPDYYSPKTNKTHEIGLILRWSEEKIQPSLASEGIKVIRLDSADVERTLEEIYSCKRIVSTSLHGLIIADTYGIPNAWQQSTTAHGGDFKYWDYLISVKKVREPQLFDFNQKGITIHKLLRAFDFDDRRIQIDLDALREVCPLSPSA